MNSGKYRDFSFSVFSLFRRLLLTVVLIGVLCPAEGRKKRTRKAKNRSHISQRAHYKPAVVDLVNPESEEFQHFLLKLKELKKGNQEQVRMLILGDSHMQCEDFGNALAACMADSFGIPLAGRGFAFPYPLARSSHRSDLSFGPNEGWHGCRFTRNDSRCPWGLAGWTAYMDRDSALFSWKMNSRPFEEGDELLLFSPPSSARSHKVTMGDSAGNGQALVYDEQKNAFRGIIRHSGPRLFFGIQRLEQGQEFVLQGFLLNPVKPGLVFGISGTNGARLDHYLLNPDFQKHLREIRPDLVLISLGTNDAFSQPFGKEEVRDFLTRLLSRVKAAAPASAILLAGPPDHCLKKKRANPKTGEINEIFSGTAEALDFVFWNQQEAMGGKGSVFEWRRQKWACPDMVHFSPSGYRKQALLLYRSLEKYLNAKY